VRSLNQSAAKELGPHGITCNVYCPSPVDTQMWTDIDKTLSAHLGGPQGALTESRVKVTPMGRLVEATDVANLVSFLAGPDSNFISGESIVVSVSVTRARRARRCRGRKNARGAWMRLEQTLTAGRGHGRLRTKKSSCV
jgi:NAD(P)-dependent dehydrogenase (short-subunit alcohol dehydrogenase family)